jgi:HlyD family secretion protein
MDQIVERRDRSPPRAPDDDRQPIEDVLGVGSGRRRSSRRWWVIGVVAAAIVGGLAYWSLQPSSSPIPTFQTVAVERGPLTVTVSSTGTLEPLTQVDVSSELSGVVRSVSVEENQRVAAGDVLAVLDTTRIEAQIDGARAGVQVAAARITEARATANETERTLARSRQLSERGMVADQALETAVAANDRAAAALEVAEANHAIALADLRLQEADLAKSTIYAPIDGIVLTRSVNPGQTVAASTQAPILFVIAENLETMELKAAIDEADIGQIDAGQTGRFRVDAFPERNFAAEIRDIAFASVVTEGVVTYEARLAVDNADLLLRPGMTASVEIVTRQADDVLLVPASAFRYSPQTSARGGGFRMTSMFSPPRTGMRGGRGAGQPGEASGDEGGRTLWVLENGAPQRVRVTTGATNGSMIEIVSGLEEGQQVITGQAASR